MKSTIKSTSKARYIAVNCALYIAYVAMVVLCIFATYQMSSSASAKSQYQGISETQLDEFGQNNILFYDPGECISSGSGSYSTSICGSTAKEKYWSALRKQFSAEVAAGIMGNIDQEGSYNPVGVESCTELNPYDFSSNSWTNGWTWDRYLNNDCSTSGSWDGCPIGKPSGIGAFGITSTRSDYLQHVNKDLPGLIKYYQDPGKYSFGGCSYMDLNGAENGGEALLSAIGEADYNALVDQDVQWMLKMLEEHWDFDLESFKKMTNVSEAADYFASHYERCNGCFDSGSATRIARRNSAEKEYAEMKDVTCNGDSSGSSSDSSSASSVSPSSSPSSTASTVSGSQITWIGDSYSVQADNKGLLSEKFSGVDIGPGNNNTSTSYIQGSKFVSSGNNSNPSCLTILQNIISSNKLRPYLVFACGTNGGWSESDVTTFTDMLKDKDTKAIVVTSKIPGNDYTDSNNRLKSMAEANDNIYLADWATVYKDNYFSGDSEKIHPVTDPGYEKWVGTITGALSSANGNSCAAYTGDYPEYRQFDTRWGGLQYGTSSADTFQNSGCGPTSMAVIATMTSGQEVLPTDIANLLEDKKDRITEGNQYYYTGYMRVLDPIVCEKYGCETETIDVSVSKSDLIAKLKQYLKDGWFIHTSGGATGNCVSGHSSVCPYSAEGHYVTLLALKDDDNTVIIEDPGWGDTAIQEYKLSDVVDSMGAAQAVRSNGKCSLNTTDTCGNNNSKGATGTSGYATAKDAKHIIDEYVADDLSGYSLLDPGSEGGPHDNCVAFSCWFITNYTEISYPGGMTGEGRDFVDVFYNAKKSEYPDLEISDTPTVYSVASWSDSSILAGSSNHTGIVIGIDKANDTILIAEAGWGNHCFTGIHGDGNGYGICSNDPYSTSSYSLSSATGGSSKYINLNKYLKSNTGLK